MCNTIPKSVTATGQPSPHSLTRFEGMHEDEKPSDLDIREVEIYLLFELLHKEADAN